MISTKAKLIRFPLQNRCRFDWGEHGEICYGSGSFQQQIEKGTKVAVGRILTNLDGVRIELKSDDDVDLQLVDISSSTNVIAWPNGIISQAYQASTVYQGDQITYSGYAGNGVNAGDEYIQFDKPTNREYEILAYGYNKGFAMITYSWTGKVGCTNSETSSSGSGFFMQNITRGESAEIGKLPAGLSDVYIRLESPGDIDIQLFDGKTPLIGWDDSSILGAYSGFSTNQYAGVEIQYSGYNGEQREGTFGYEYIFLRGTLTKSVTLKVSAYSSGLASVEYSWGYYAKAKNSDTSALREKLHHIIKNHTKHSYKTTWDLLKRTDQDATTPSNVRLLYSRKSVPKTLQDNGTGGDRWNREHVWAKSHGNFGTAPGAGTDLHALRASDASVNADRSAKDFDNGGIALDGAGSASDCSECLEDSDSFEPPDEVKGDIARMIFYMATRYDGDQLSNGLKLDVVDTTGTPYGMGTTGSGQIGKLSALKKWNKEDPPSEEEKHRNNMVFAIQGNRNPFIDHYEWVELIF